MRVFGVYSGEDPGQIQDFSAQIGVGFPLINDPENGLSQFAFPPGVGFPYPRDIVIDRSGTVRAIRNSFNVEEMTALVEALIAEPAP